MLILLSGGSVSSGPALARPSAPAFIMDPGEDDGEIFLTVTDLPASWGDLAAHGDGLGEAGILQWWNARSGWQTLADPADTGESLLHLHPSLWSSTAIIRVRGVSAAGRPGVSATDTVEVPGPLMAEEVVTSGGIPVTSGGATVTAFVPA